MPRHIKDLKPDPQNRRAHTPRNIGMVSDALRDVGAARSIVIDEDDVVLAGNGVVEAAADAGITRLKVVDVDGETLVAVRRKGLSAAQKRALAIYDNRTAELANWDLEQLQADKDAGLDLEPFWTDAERSALLSAPGDDDWKEALGGVGETGRDGFQQMTFSLTDDQVEMVKRALAEVPGDHNEDVTGNPNRNGNALAWVCQTYVGETVAPAARVVG